MNHVSQIARKNKIQIKFLPGFYVDCDTVHIQTWNMLPLHFLPEQSHVHEQWQEPQLQNCEQSHSGLHPRHKRGTTYI